ncbi:MBOAT-domain-containing protein [Periconia macrospinosa]|uniref:MBOAT-domain-containing protein n=1 Tax=Periconia macrospinosa TaxID=97972 RepID=A0A2V1E8W3_9PLEO|nr:MBOAT-domain-containing protein [Periconia macrospinosa]
MILRNLRRFYSPDTLDTRFIVPANAPPKEALELAELDPTRPLPAHNGQAKGKGLEDEIQPSQWNTLEFKAYVFIVGLCVIFMTKTVVDVSKESHPAYHQYAHRLSKGWIPGRQVDNSDQQYDSFRSNLPYLFIVVILHPLLRKAYDGFWRADTYGNARPGAVSAAGGLTMGLPPSAAADVRLNQRMSFDVVFGFIFITALHGTSIVKMLLILYINYNIAKKLPKPYIPAATWVFNVGIMFLNDIYRGYVYGDILGFILPSHRGTPEQPWRTNMAYTLDMYRGLIARWEVLFNFTVLRLISFNMDYYWSLNTTEGSSLEKQLDPSNLSERDRVAIPAKSSDFSFRNYFAYAVYSPLYLAGPIVTFNDYISQLRYRPHSISTKRTKLYALRFIIVLLTMEVMIHYCYMVAIFQERPDWSQFTPAQLSMLGFFNLKHIWLKLLIPWRFFRLWALLDGIDPPENMVRCMSDNYAVTNFWRGWHRSFNRWSLRYLFIPLGGSHSSGFRGKARTTLNYLAVFSFIAIWHDIKLRLLMWGWLVTLFVLPEFFAAKLFPARKWKDSPNAYRYLCALGAVGEVLMLMIANLVGFALGLDGLADLIHGIMSSWSGLGFLLVSCTAIFFAVQLMFEKRESEKRRGIRTRC